MKASAKSPAKQTESAKQIGYMASLQRARRDPS